MEHFLWIGVDVLGPFAEESIHPLGTAILKWQYLTMLFKIE